MSYKQFSLILSNTFKRGQPTIALTRESNNNLSYKKQRKYYKQQPHDGYYYYCKDDGKLKNPSPWFWIKYKSMNLTKLCDWSINTKRTTNRQNQLRVPHTHIHIHTHTYIYIHTHTHTHTHTYIYIYIHTP